MVKKVKLSQLRQMVRGMIKQQIEASSNKSGIKNFGKAQITQSAYDTLFQNTAEKLMTKIGRQLSTSGIRD